MTSTWESQAACLGVDPDVLFPDLETEGRDNHGTAAKRICAQCPVVEPCLIAAIERREQHGIWGGAGGGDNGTLAWLGKNYRKCGKQSPRWRSVLARHVADLRSILEPSAKRDVVDRNGPGATHGLRITYNRGCRCRACKWAAADDVADRKRTA